MDQRLTNLDNDIVIKQRDRFAQLEKNVKVMLERKALNGGNNQITPAQLQKILQQTRETPGGTADANEAGNSHIVQFKSEEEEQTKCYTYLWASEKCYLQGMSLFLLLTQHQEQRSQTHQASLNYIYDDILRLDFTKCKSVVHEYQETQRVKR